MPTTANDVATYTAAWPDGRVVQIYAAEPMEAAVAERIAVGVQPVSIEDVRARSGEIGERLGQGPVTVSATVPSGRIEVIGDGEPTAICFFEAAGSRACRGRLGNWEGWPQPLVGSALIGSQWYVFAAGEGPVTLNVGSRFSGRGTAVPSDGSEPSGTAEVTSTTAVEDQRQYPPEIATADGWTLAVIAVPDTMDEVLANVGDLGVQVPRPLF